MIQIRALILAAIAAGAFFGAPAPAAQDLSAKSPAASAISHAADGTYLVVTTCNGELRLHLGAPSADSLDVALDEGTTLVGVSDAVLQTAQAEPAVAMLITPRDELLVGWASQGRAFLATCSLSAEGGARRALRRACFAGIHELGPGHPSAIAWNPRSCSAIVAGCEADKGGTIWTARPAGAGSWTRDKIATGQGNVALQVAVSKLGVAHVVWRDAGGAVWHLESESGDRWLRSGATSSQPEKIGAAAAEPAIACADHQVLVVLPTNQGQLAYSLYTGQNWNTDLPLSALDKRWANDRLSRPRLVADGLGARWLFFVNTTGHRKYAYFTRWLGFGWDTIREGRGIFHVTDGFLDNLAPIEDLSLPAHVTPGSGEFGLLLASHGIPKPLRVHRIQTPAPIGRPGTEILFLDMLDVGESLWTEQVLQTARKHPANPVMAPGGVPRAIDSHRVFNGGIVLRDGAVFKSWYSAANPEGDWKRWWDLLHFYYGAADYQAPTDQPFEYERWKKCRMGMGLATLPLDGWTYLRNAAGHHVGYITTVPVLVDDLKGCVLTVNAQADKDNYLLAELLQGDGRDRIPGYEQENSDKMDCSGAEQVMSWHGKAGLDGVKARSVRVRVIFRGRGDALRLYSLGFCRRPGAVPPEALIAEKGLVEKELLYRSSVSHLDPLKAWMAYRPDGKKKPVVVAMHGYGDPVLRHGGRRMAGTTRDYAKKGLFALAVDLRGREESAGQRDDGGLEVMDIHDAVQAALRQYPSETDSDCVNITGWSGGGGNTFSAVTRMPDLFSNAAAFFGITDYGYWADTSFKGLIQPNVGGETGEVPDRYLARKSLLGVGNNAWTNFHFFWDEKERICPVWMDSEYRRIARELGRKNVTPHESRQTDKARWLHEGMDRASAVEAARLIMPPFHGRNNPRPTIAPEGKLMVLGYLMTKRFQVLFGQGNDAVAEVTYKLSPQEYRFTFSPRSSDRNVRGWLRITDRAASEVSSVAQNGQGLAWETLDDGRIMIRDVRPDAAILVRYKPAANGGNSHTKPGA